MYLTNQQLITQRNDSGGTPEQFREYVTVIASLVKKYGSSNVRGGLLESIKKVDSDLADMVSLLDVVGKLDLKNISSLLGEVGGGVSEGYIVKSTNPGLVAEKSPQPSLKKREHAEITTSKVGVQISGDGKIYKRGLDRDLDKMLR